MDTELIKTLNRIIESLQSNIDLSLEKEDLYFLKNFFDTVLSINLNKEEINLLIILLFILEDFKNKDVKFYSLEKELKYKIIRFLSENLNSDNNSQNNNITDDQIFRGKEVKNRYQVIVKNKNNITEIKTIVEYVDGTKSIYSEKINNIEDDELTFEDMYNDIGSSLLMTIQQKENNENFIIEEDKESNEIYLLE